MPYRLALTGSIGMGKSTTARMFAELGVPVWDADAAVHELYAKGGAAVAPISALISEARVEGAIDRSILRDKVKEDPALLEDIERIVHPLVAKNRDAFLTANAKKPLVVLDIPLLFETGGDRFADGVLVVTTDKTTQAMRVLARPGMTDTLFRSILDRQVPDEEKRKRADFIVRTDNLEQARQDVSDLVQTLVAQQEDQNNA